MPELVEWLLGNPWVAFVEGRLELPVPWLLVPVVFGVLWWGVHHQLGRAGFPRLGKGRQVWLAGIRGALLTLVVLCLLGPELVFSTVAPQDNAVAVLLDDSASMRIADANGGEARRGDFLLSGFSAEEGNSDGLGSALSRLFVTRLFRFSDTTERVESAAELGFAGPRTDIASALGAVVEGVSFGRLAGIVLLTDGADTMAGADPAAMRDMLLALREGGVPVYPVMLGAESFDRDLALGEPDLPPRVLRGSRLEVRIPLRARGLDGETARLEVLDEGRIAATRTVRIVGDDFETAVTALVPAEEGGVRQLRFRVAPFPGEMLTRNNERERLLEVDTRTVSVLYFEGQPRFEFKFLRRAVRHDPELRVAGMVRTAEGKFYRVDMDSPEELAGGFPDSREELYGYEAVILGSVEASFFTREQLNMLRDLVAVRGGGLLALGGSASFSEGGYRGTPLAEVLPLSLPEIPGDAAIPGGAAPVFRELQVFPTRAGSTHPVVRLESDPDSNEGRYRDLPPLSAVNRPGIPKPGAVVLLEGLVPGGRASEPVLLHQRFGRGRSASLTVQDFWIWQMHASIPLEDDTHEVVWQRLLRWLVAETPRRIEAEADPPEAPPGEDIRITATVRDRRFLEVNDAVVEATVRKPDGGRELVPLTWTGTRDGAYAGIFEGAATGIHEVEVRVLEAATGAAGEGTDPEPARTWFRSGTVSDEYFDAEADRALLDRIADATGGRVFLPEDAGQVVEHLRIADTGVTVTERHQLAFVPAFFLLIFWLLGGEWILRNRWGLP